RFLEQALAYYRRNVRAAAEAGDRSRAAQAYRRMGWLQMRLGLDTEGEGALRAAAPQDERPAGPPPPRAPRPPPFRPTPPNAGPQSGGSGWAGWGRAGEAEAESRQALREQERLGAEPAVVPECRRDLAASHANLGRLLTGLGRRAEAEAEFRQALKEQERLVA